MENKVLVLNIEEWENSQSQVTVAKQLHIVPSNIVK